VQVALLIFVNGRRDLISWLVFPWQGENGLAYLALSSVTKKKVYNWHTDNIRNVRRVPEMLYTVSSLLSMGPNKLEHLTLTNHSCLV
jgi:hypothetical protein